MKTTFDTDSILYNILLNSPLKNAISGGFYLGEDRPDDPEEEDVVIILWVTSLHFWLCLTRS